MGALFWSTGGQGSRWPSEVMEYIGEERDLPYASAGAYHATESILRMYDRGEDPQQALIARGRELGLHVFASVRMNDNHFGGSQVGDLGALRKARRVEALRHDHPEWLLGESTSEWFALSWNMAVPEVRQRRFDHVEESLPPLRLGRDRAGLGSATPSTSPTTTATGCATCSPTCSARSAG